MPLDYTSDAKHLYRLPDFSPIDAAGIVWSARRSQRRGVLNIISDHLEAHLHNATTIRLGLNPVGMRHDFSRRYWLVTVERLLEKGRAPMTKLVSLQGQRPARSAA